MNSPNENKIKKQPVDKMLGQFFSERDMALLLDLASYSNNIERMPRNKSAIEKAPLYKMACKTIMERIEDELCAK